VRVMSEEQIVEITESLPYATSTGGTGQESKFTDTECLVLRRPTNSGFRTGTVRVEAVRAVDRNSIRIDSPASAYCN
jgi:hypothetical protein